MRGSNRPRDPYGSTNSSTPTAGRNVIGSSSQPTDAELLAEYGSGSMQQSYNQSTPYYQKSAPSHSSAYRDPYAVQNGIQGFDPEEEEIQGLKYQIRSTKQESLSSTRNALRLARETEETATNTMVKLGEQSGMSDKA